jgi:hypothetical protein
MKPRYVRVTTIRRIQMGATLFVSCGCRMIRMFQAYAPDTDLDKIRGGGGGIALITLMCKEACQ